MAVFTVRMDDDLYNLLRGEAFGRRTSMSKLIREAVMVWLASQDEPVT